MANEIIDRNLAKLRKSVTYFNWRQANKQISCFKCDSTEDLELHHRTELKKTYQDTYKILGCHKSTYEDIELKHKQNQLECDTLCSKCHDARHNKTRTPITFELTEDIIEQIKHDSLYTVMPMYLRRAIPDIYTTSKHKLKNGHINVDINAAAA